jgi:rhodanese-related sulfurtransferase
MLDEGAILVDIRETDEHARTRIAAARNVPLAELGRANAVFRAGKPVIFHCLSGMRTNANASQLKAHAGSCEAFMLEGGLNAWRKAGLPVEVDRSRPIEVQRQVQIVAGGLGFAGTLLGLTVSPWFFAVPAFVGAGLMFAGITGFCGMALLLVRAPWNRSALRRTHG